MPDKDPKPMEEMADAELLDVYEEELRGIEEALKKTVIPPEEENLPERAENLRKKIKTLKQRTGGGA